MHHSCRPPGSEGDMSARPLLEIMRRLLTCRHHSAPRRTRTSPPLPSLQLLHHLREEHWIRPSPRRDRLCQYAVSASHQHRSHLTALLPQHPYSPSSATISLDTRPSSSAPALRRQPELRSQANCREGPVGRLRGTHQPRRPSRRRLSSTRPPQRTT
eukprot:5260276-Prymnesium_polylepis.2